MKKEIAQKKAKCHERAKKKKTPEKHIRSIYCGGLCFYAAQMMCAHCLFFCSLFENWSLWISYNHLSFGVLVEKYRLNTNTHKCYITKSIP